MNPMPTLTTQPRWSASLLIVLVSLISLIGPSNLFANTAQNDYDIGENDFWISNLVPNELAVAYNSQNNEYLVIWTGFDSLEFTDVIYGQRLDADGVEIGVDDFPISVSFIEDTLRDQAAIPESFVSFITNRPAVTYNSDTEEYMVVWSDGFDGDDFIEFEINGRRLDATGEKQGSELEISDITQNEEIGYIHDDPDVVYNPLDQEYLVTWAVDNIIGFDDVEWEVYGQRLNGATGEDVGADDFRISRMGPEGDRSYQALTPALAHNSRDNAYLVTWAGDDNTGALVEDEFEIYGQRLAGQNNPDPTPTPTPTTPPATATPTADPVATATPTTPPATATPTADPVVTPTPTPNVPPVGSSRVFLPLTIR